MNFRTTILLVILLLMAGGLALLINYRQNKEPVEAKDDRKLVDLATEDVKQLAVTPAGGKRMVLEKSGTEWKLVEPVSAAADTFAVDSLVRGLVELRVREQVDANDAAGVANPRFAVEISGKDKSYKLNVGNASVVGNNLYVQVAGQPKVAVVAADVVEQLDKPYTNYRQTRLFSAAGGQIRQLEISKPDSKLVLRKPGMDWEVVEPQKMPAEASEVSDITTAISSLAAAEFVDPSEVPSALLPKSNKRLTVWFATDAPTTQPTTGPATRPAGVTLEFGGYDTVLRQNVYVAVSNPAVLMKVPASSMAAFEKKPIDLRDRRVLDIEPGQVSKLVIISDSPATTQPVAKAAAKSEVVIERKKQSLVALGPEVGLIAPPTTRPTTGPSTGPATQASAPQPTTQTAATQPALPPSDWTLAGKGDADQAKIEALLEKLHPLRVEKYVAGPFPTTQPAPRFVVRVWTEAAGGAKSGQHEFRLVDQGEGKPLIGEYNGLVFELAHSFVEGIGGDWANKPKPPEMEMPMGPPGRGLPFGLPPGHP
jgi:hypothetical protein